MEFRATDKYYAMIRAYERLERIGTNNGQTISQTDPSDAVESFFNQCHHFKDWLKKDYTVLSKDIEHFVSRSLPLSLASDYCNSFKHAGLDKPPRSGKTLEKINRHYDLRIGPQEVNTSARLELTFDGKKYDTVKLARECLEYWDEFLSQNNIDLSDLNS